MSYKTPIPPEVCGQLTRNVGEICGMLPKEQRAVWNSALVKYSFGLARNFQVEELGRFRRVQVFHPESAHAGQENLTSYHAQTIIESTNRAFNALKDRPDGPDVLLRMAHEQQTERVDVLTKFNDRDRASGMNVKIAVPVDI